MPSTLRSHAKAKSSASTSSPTTATTLTSSPAKATIRLDGQIPTRVSPTSSPSAIMTMPVHRLRPRPPPVLHSSSPRPSKRRKTTRSLSTSLPIAITRPSRPPRRRPSTDHDEPHPSVVPPKETPPVLHQRFLSTRPRSVRPLQRPRHHEARRLHLGQETPRRSPSTRNGQNQQHGVLRTTCLQGDLHELI